MKKLLLLLGLALAAPAAQAQYFLVASPQANQNPGGLNTDDEYPVGGGLATTWTTLFTGSAATFAAPTWTNVVTVPFPFQFNGVAETQYKVATSGVLTFTTSATAVPSASNTALPSANLPDKSVAIWGMGATMGDFIVTKTFGTAPNRQHWVQFNSYSKPGAMIFTYWSIVLEETTNKIYVVDQRTSDPAAPTVTVGVQVNATTALQTAASPAQNTLTTANATPADNSYYTFTYGSQPARDLALTALTLPSIASRQQAITVAGTLANQGTQAVTSYVLNYKVGAQPTVSAPVSGATLAPQASRNFAHPTPWTPTVTGQYLLRVWASAPNGLSDQNPLNDTLRATVRVVEDSLRRFVVEECFTSSTCPPCRPGNVIVEAVNRANAGKQVVIKYQQNFPAPGNDPYYTAEAGARRGYYAINAIPYMTLDGGWNNNSNSFTAAVLDQFYAVPVTMRVRGTYSIAASGVVSARATIRPFQAVAAGQFVAHMVITERRTVRNIRTNGETEFFHVMKKMMPNENGTPVPALAAGRAFVLNQSFDMSTLPAAQAAENRDSLEVVTFVQNLATKEIYQGSSLTFQRISATRNAQTGVAFSLAPNPATGRATLFLTLPRAGTVRVQVLDALGRAVLDRPALPLAAGPQQVPLVLGQQAAGLYTVRLTTEQGVSTQKLTLE